MQKETSQQTKRKKKPTTQKSLKQLKRPDWWASRWRAGTVPELVHLYKMALKLLKQLNSLIVGNMSSYLEDGGHILDSPLSYHFARGETFRNSRSRGGVGMEEMKGEAMA